MLKKKNLFVVTPNNHHGRDNGLSPLLSSTSPTMTVGTHSIAESDPRFPSHRHVNHLARPTAHELIADCHQMLFNLEWEWGSVLHWKHLFIEELNDLQRSGFANAERWFGQLRGRVSAGEGILEHLAHIMDSELPQDIKEFRHIW